MSCCDTRILSLVDQRPLSDRTAGSFLLDILLALQRELLFAWDKHTQLTWFAGSREFWVTQLRLPSYTHDGPQPGGEPRLDARAVFTHDWCLLRAPPGPLLPDLRVRGTECWNFDTGCLGVGVRGFLSRRPREQRCSSELDPARSHICHLPTDLHHTAITQSEPWTTKTRPDNSGWHPVWSRVSLQSVAGKRLETLCKNIRAFPFEGSGKFRESVRTLGIIMDAPCDRTVGKVERHWR